jgi:putative addiction module component (TIGR02574 family)
MRSERVRKILALAEQLEPEERAELADDLWATLPEELRGDDDLEHEEIERRLDDVHGGHVDGVAWEQAHASLRAELATMPRR